MGEQQEIDTQTPPSSPPPPPQTSQNPPNSSKIPVRPHKLRKLSSPPPPKPRKKATLPPPTPQKPLSYPNEINSALRHLANDPLLAELINSLAPPSFDTHQAPFLALTKSILYQQLAYKAGTQIYQKFVELCGGENSVVPDTVLALSAQNLKTIQFVELCGGENSVVPDTVALSAQNLKTIQVSSRKTSYLFDLAHKFKTGILSDDSIMKMDDKSLFTMLSMVKGIGSWSVHMFMIFSLHRPDVLPVSDIGVRKGVQILYGLEELPRPSQMELLCEKWKPYRSVGAWYMWRLVEGKGAPQVGAMAAFECVSVMPLQEQQVESEEKHHHQLQLPESINGEVNFGECGWAQ